MPPERHPSLVRRDPFEVIDVALTRWRGGPSLFREVTRPGVQYNFIAAGSAEVAGA